MASEILGLFTTPQQYQQNQLAQFQNRAATEVQLNPFQQAALQKAFSGLNFGFGSGSAPSGAAGYNISPSAFGEYYGRL